MAIVTTGAGINLDPANEGPSFYWQFLNFLLTNTNWTSPGSGNNVIGGIGVAAVTSQADLQTNVSWFVIEDPDGTVQFLFTRNGANDLSWGIYLNPHADYAGGGAAVVPTSAGGHTQIYNAITVNAGVLRFHMLAGDGVATADAGWAIYCHAQGVFTSPAGSMAFVPMTVEATSDTRPYVFGLGLTTTNLYYYQNSTNPASTAVRWVGVQPGGTSVQNVPPAHYKNFTSGADVTPGLAGVDSNEEEVQLPMLWCRYSSLATPFFKGITSYWASWPGVSHQQCDTYDNHARIDFGGMTFPWDDVSIPTVA